MKIHTEGVNSEKLNLIRIKCWARNKKNTVSIKHVLGVYYL